MTPHRILLVAAIALSVSGATSCTTESKVKLDPGALAALETFDYADWSATLSAFVDEEGKVDYAALKQDRGHLDRFVALLAAVGPQTRPALFGRHEDQLAYYLNAYNALTMFNVVNRYPDITTVYDERYDFFGLTFFRLDGERTNVNDLEQSLIRPRFEEPRVHFALNCASAGCPRLPATPFLPDTLEEQLVRETDAFLHRPDNVQLKAPTDTEVRRLNKANPKLPPPSTLVLSQIFEWYAEDFSPAPADWIRDHAPDLGIPLGVRVAYTPYDWSLNGQRR